MQPTLGSHVSSVKGSSSSQSRGFPAVQKPAEHVRSIRHAWSTQSAVV
jgi:hypothetical protein